MMELLFELVRKSFRVIEHSLDDLDKTLKEVKDYRNNSKAECFSSPFHKSVKQFKYATKDKKYIFVITSRGDFSVFDKTSHRYNHTWVMLPRCLFYDIAKIKNQKLEKNAFTCTVYTSRSTRGYNLSYNLKSRLWTQI